MFHWICPECGREIPPAVKECPQCDPKAAATPVESPKAAAAVAPALPPDPAPDPLLALAEHIRRVQRESREVAAPAPVPVGVAVAVEVEAAPPKISILQFFPVTQAIALLPPPEVVAPAELAAPVTVPVTVDVPPAVMVPAPEAQPRPVPNGPPPLITQLAAPDEERLPSGSWLRLAPLQDYKPVASQAMKPAPPPREILMPDSGPRMTLPGPALPPGLEKLQNSGVVTVLGAQRRTRRLPGWLVSGMLMLGIPLAGGALLLYFQPLQKSAAEAKTPSPVSAPAAVAPAPAQASHSLADFIEVTGFRIVVDFNKKSEIHYLVVNHSPAALSDLMVYVTLRTADARTGQPPLCRFSFRAPGLGAFESKEMISPIEKLSRTVVLPEWQDLRADVQLGQ